MVVGRFADELMEKAKHNPVFANHAYVYYLVAGKPRQALEAKMHFFRYSLDPVHGNPPQKRAMQLNFEKRIGRLSQVLNAVMHDSYIEGPKGNRSLAEYLRQNIQADTQAMPSIGAGQVTRRLKAMRPGKARMEHTEASQWIGKHIPAAFFSHAPVLRDAIDQKLNAELCRLTTDERAGFDVADIIDARGLPSFLHAVFLRTTSERNP